MLKAFLIAILSLSIFSLSGCGTPPGPRYQNVHSFSEGLAAVQGKNGRWGFMNEKQIVVIAPRFEEVKEFSSGKAAVKLNGRWGFINKRGEWL